MFRNALLITSLLFLTVKASAQFSHELGIGIAGLRTWETGEVENPIEDLDFYYSPTFNYQIYYRERFSLMIQIGRINEFASRDVMIPNGPSGKEWETRWSLMTDIELGYNFWLNERSFLQVSGGVRVNWPIRWTYRYEGNDGTIGELDGTSTPLDYNVSTAIAYQYNLLRSKNSRHSLALRCSFEFVYYRPKVYRLNPIYSSSFQPQRYGQWGIGNSVALIWRIRTKQEL